VDSRSTAGSMVLLLRRLMDLIAQELSFEQVVEQIESYRNDMHILFSLASFDNLVKTGRMSRAAGVLASALNIRAVATNTSEGTISVLEKPRGEKKAIDRMVALMSTFKDPTGKPVVITHCNNPAGAEAIRQAVQKAYAVSDITVLSTRCLTSFYSGDQGLLLCF
ncbi:MAG: DegV family protein, partial [Oscillospiraceae bacterium]